jgi:phosphopantothenoylcysteine synthetase/decarboxylase
VVVAPATFNTINKLAAGIADTYAHSTACEAIGTRIPVVLVPMVNTALWGHPALTESLRRLEGAGVRCLDVQSGGAPRAVESGTGATVVARFDPEWIMAVIGRPARIS